MRQNVKTRKKKKKDTIERNGEVEIYWPRLCIPLLLNISSSSEAGQASMRALERRV